MSLATLFLFLSAPAHADAVIVGHPVELRIAAGTGLTFTSVALSVTDQVVEFCDATTLTIPIDAVLGLGDLILLPKGEICGIDLYLNATTQIAGIGNSGGSFTMSLQLAVIQIEVYPSLTVSTTGTSDADAVELADPNWVTATDLQLSTGVVRTITSTSSQHNGLRNAIRNRSSIVR